MRKKQAWLGVSGGQRQNHTKPMSETTVVRRLRKAVAKALGERKRSADEFGTLHYPTPTASQIVKAGL